MTTTNNFAFLTVILTIQLGVTNDIRSQKFVVEGPNSGVTTESGIVSKNYGNGFEAFNSNFSGLVSINIMFTRVNRSDTAK